jgi:hypothetical protein
MDWICFILVNSCVMWGLKLEPRTVSLSTLGIISCTHVDTPNNSEYLGGWIMLNLRRYSDCMQNLSAREIETENHLIHSHQIEGRHGKNLRTLDKYPK